MQWSEAKKELFRFESDIVVSAGAGSGKTAALVELYLRLLAGETALGRALAVDEIVAITFTDKAATEMKERVRNGVRERLDGGTDRQLWETHRRALPGASIATFHSFCSRILRENPAEAGVDPTFVLLDEMTAGAELQEALDEVIGEELGKRSEEIRLLLRYFPLSGRGHGQGLAEHLIALHWQRVGSAAPASEVLRQTGEWDASARLRFAEETGRLAELLGEVRRILQGKPLQFHEKLRALPEIHAAARLAPESASTPAEVAAMQRCIVGGWGKEKPVRDALTACLETLGLCTLQLLGAPVAAALLELSEKVESAYRLRKERRGALDFDDLQRAARDLLVRDAELRDACRRRFAVVMVDEFQDTNPLQKELVGLLCGPGQRLFVVGDPKQSIYLFRGADVTVFAEAEREIAERGGRTLYFQESFRSRQGIITFVNHLFSRVMGAREAEFEVRYREGDHLEAQRADWDGTPCVELLATGREGAADDRRRREAAAIEARIARLVSGRDEVRVYDKRSGSGDSEPGTGGNPDPVFVPRTPRFGDIAILFRRFTNLKLYERELRRRGIPYYVVKGRGFYRCQEVLDLLNFLTWLEFGGNLAALAGVLRSPLCGVSDETLYLLSRLDGGIGRWEALFRESRVPSPESPLLDRIDPADRVKLAHLSHLVGRLRPLRDRLTLAELLEEILTGTDFASTLLTTFQGEQKVANLRKLIEISRTFAPPEGGSLRRFVNYLTELVDTEPTEAEALVAAEGEDVVRLMTVHQSKGLEFPVVFVPELGMPAPADNSAVLYDDRRGIGVKLAFPGDSGRPTLAHRELAASRRHKEAAELKRLFYVAVTRARDHLVLSGEGKGEWRAWLDAFLAEGGDGLVRAVDGASLSTEGETGAPPPAAKTGCDPSALALGLQRSLHYAPPLPSEMVFSPTALEDYRTCPRKYFYKAVLGLDEGLFAELLGAPAGRDTRARDGMSALDKGNLAHFLLERLDFTAPPDRQRAACERLAPLCGIDAADPGVAEVIDRVMSFAGGRLARELGTRQLFREQPFTLTLHGSANYYVRGAMDLVAVTDGEAAVYDYKYLRREDADLEGYRFQLRTYMVALARAFPGKRVVGRLLFLRGGGDEEVECDVDRFTEELREIMDAARERSSEPEFGLRPGCDGSHCPFRQRCIKNGSTFNVLRSTFKPGT